MKHCLRFYLKILFLKYFINYSYLIISDATQNLHGKGMRCNIVWRQKDALIGASRIYIRHRLCQGFVQFAPFKYFSIFTMGSMNVFNDQM